MKLEAWMARLEIAPILAKEFAVVNIDTGRTAGGKEMMNKTKGKSGGIPWFHILDAEGAELVNSNGPKGNIGCPDTDEEVDYFMEMLKKVKSALTDDDLALLKKSLISNREKK